MKNPNPTVRSTDDEKLATSLWGENKRWDEGRGYVPTYTEEQYNDAVSRQGTASFSKDDKHVVRGWLEQQDKLDAGQVDEVVGEKEQVDYDSWKVDKLQAELKERELPSSGTKTELVQRLKDDDAENED